MPVNKPILLTDEQIDALTPEQRAEYEHYLEQHVVGWNLTPKQQRAEDLTRHCFEVGYGGAAGGGKSDWGLWHVYELSKRIPGHRALVLRTVRPELRRSLIPRSQQKFDETLCHYRPGDYEWRFHNQSVIEFGFLDNDDAVYQYKSAEYDCIFFDECTELSEHQYMYLLSRCRTTRWKRKLGAWPHIINATNPGGKGHAWYKNRFVTSTDYGRNIAEVPIEDPDTGIVLATRLVAFVPATLLDNPHIDPEYRLNLLQQPEITQRQLLYGDWDVFEGQFFNEYRRELHVVEDFKIPEEWTRIRGIDYGYAAPYCCLWVAFDQDGDGYVYRERYVKRLTADEQARQMVQASRLPDGRPEKIAYSVADPSIWAKQGTGDSIAMQYHRGGVTSRKALNARKDGWSVVRHWLKPRVELEGTPPRLRIFEKACPNLIRTLPDMLHQKPPKDPEDLDTTLEDHAVDALRYALMSRPRFPRPRRRPEPVTLEERIAARFRQLDREERLGRRGPSSAVHPDLGRIHT